MWLLTLLIVLFLAILGMMLYANWPSSEKMECGGCGQCPRCRQGSCNQCGMSAGQCQCRSLNQNRVRGGNGSCSFC